MTIESDFEPAVVPLPKAYLLLNHGPVTLISSAYDGRQNVMAAAWVMPLDFAPPKIALVIDKQTYTRHLIEESGTFVVNIPSQRLVSQIKWAGSETGHSVDKLTELKALRAGSRVPAALLAGCLGWLECKVIPESHNQQQHDLFIAEVLAAWSDPRVFHDGRWHFEEASDRTVHYSAGGQFFLTGPSINA
ncbi:MAG TPA: flavin reductase family protein [Aquabacterium sp.]|nr:flavin reductase family protein [Aquabacterium sp.]